MLYRLNVESTEGTALHMRTAQLPPYMEWICQVPIHPRTISVDYVHIGESVKENGDRDSA